MVLTAATSGEEVPVPTNSSTVGMDVPVTALAATSATDGGVCCWDADQFDEPHPVEMIKASKPADTIRERDTRTRWWERNARSLLEDVRSPNRGPQTHVWDFDF